MKFVGVKMNEDEYQMYRKLAKMEGKNFSQWVREKLKEAVKQEMKEVNLLNKLIKLIEELPLKLQVQSQKGEEFSQVARLLVYLVKFLEMLSEYLIVIEMKKREFQARKEELKRNMGIEL
jgi:hypothetical protein